MCYKKYGHNIPHECDHGHIINASIFTEEKYIRLKYEGALYNFQNEDTAIMYNCYQFCREMERGHIHIINKSELQHVQNIQYYFNENFIRILNDDSYECKCEFFWKCYLKFEFDNKFTPNEKENFNKCPAICPLCNGKKQYCEEKLWHKPILNQENSKEYWFSKEGHKFTCYHPIPWHTIFVIDKSGSMDRGDITPNIPSIYSNGNFNNRMGKLIEIMNNYLDNRNRNNNKEDMFSLVVFSDNSKIIFENHSILPEKDFNFIKNCMDKIGKCEGETIFYLGFNKAEEIVTKIDRKKFKPVIILFSDGEDQKKDETIKSVKRVRQYFINNIIYYLYLL